MIKYNEPMSKHTSLRVGGKAKVYFIPQSREELIYFLKTNKLPLLFIGLGSNLLVLDKGFSGVVINTMAIKNITINDNYIKADTGASLAKLARFAKNNNFTGFSFFIGIPGSIGGALAMNAGAFGFETWEYIHKVETINSNGDINIRNIDDYEISYRNVKHNYKNEYFLSAKLVSKNDVKDESIIKLIKKRNKAQPIGSASCGSVFKNPKNHYAGDLIEKAGLKNFCIGKACVAEKHANFIINTGGATSLDVYKLIKHIKNVVKSKFAIELEEEVKII